MINLHGHLTEQAGPGRAVTTGLTCVNSDNWALRVGGWRPRRIDGLPRNRLRPDVPVVDTPHALAATTTMILVVSAAVMALASSTRLPASADPDGLRLLPALTLLPSIGVITYGRRWPSAAFHPVLVATTVLISGSVVFSGSSPIAIALSILYSLPVLAAFLFFSWRTATVHLVITAVVGGLAMGWSGNDSIIEPLVVVAVAGVVGLMVGRHVRSAASAEIDVVTGLPNRAGFDRQLADCLTRMEDNDSILTLALIDFDSFTGVNEQVGRAAGDRMLRDTAAAWQALLPSSARMARVGGDEFAIVFPGSAPAEAAKHVERLRRAMPHQRSFSAGMATGESGDTPSLVMDRADTLLYRAKRDGQNRTTCEERRVPTVAQLRTAIGSGQLTPVFQPIIALGTGHMIGVEALIRWQHPDRGQLPPSEFIPVAEESGLITDIGTWMLHQSCRHAAEWTEAGLIEKVTVNVSGRELVEPGYADVVADVLYRTGLDPRHLILEVTETTLDADAPDITRTLRILHEQGVRIAIDDFGTGFSTLSRLDRLPVDVLKIDRSFIANLSADPMDAPLVSAIVAFGHALGLTLVAEGIEQPHQYRTLTSLGCDEGQGFLFGVPSAPERSRSERVSEFRDTLSSRVFPVQRPCG